MTTPAQGQQFNSDEEKPLQVRLDVADQCSGQYILTFGFSQYSVRLQPEASITLSEWLRRLRPVLTGYNDPGGDLDPQDLLRNIGVWLWRTLLPESAPLQEREVLAHTLRTGHTPLLLSLPDMLAGLPWELLCDPDQTGERGFLARRRPLMRLSDSTLSMAPIEPPLRVLLLISSPPSLGEDSRVDVESERAAVEQATHNAREEGKLHLLVEDIVTPKRVQQVLMCFKPHIVHYIGHGEYDPTHGGMLLWEDEQGSSLRFSAERLAALLHSRNLHGVVLHSCETARGNAQAEVHSLAGILIQNGLPTVLAQQASFTYESSQLASRAWYQALVSGQSMADAILAVRQTLIEADQPDWAVPILQGSTASLESVLDDTSPSGSPDPMLTVVGAAADLSTPIEIFVGRHRELRALHLMLEDTLGNSSVLALITGPGGMGKSTLVAQAVIRYGRLYKAALMLRCQEYRSLDLFLQKIGEFLKRLGASSFPEQTLPDPKLSIEAKIDEVVIALNTAGPVLLVIDNLENVQNEEHLITDKALLYLLQKLLTTFHSGRVLITGRSTAKDLLSQGGFEANLLHLNLEDLSPYETHQLLLRYPTLARLGETVRKKLIEEFGGLPYVYDLLSSKAASQDLEALIHDVQGRITEEHKRLTVEKWQEVRRQVIEFAALEATVYHLSETSRVLLAQLSVLYQSFPLAAIEEGLGASRPAWQPLLDWSLLHYDLHEKTYRLHNLTRRYAEGLLEEHSRKQVQVQLAIWYEHYADQTSHNLTDFLEEYRLLSAAGSLQQAGQLVMRLAETLRRFGLYPLLRDLCVKTLRDLHESDEWLAASALRELGILAYAQGKYEEARDFHQPSLEIFQRLGDQSGQAGTLHLLGIIAQSQGEYEQAEGLYQQGLEIFKQLGNQSGRANTLLSLGILAQDQGEYEQAQSLYQQSLDVFEQLGDQNAQARARFQLGNLAFFQREYERARGFYQQSLEINERQENQDGLAQSLRALGMIAQERGEYERARGLYQQSLEIAEQLRALDIQAKILHQIGMIAQDQGEYEQARGFYQQNLEIFRRIGDQGGLAATLHQIGTIAQDQGEYEQARGFYQQSLGISQRIGDQGGLAATLFQLGKIDQDQGKYEQACTFYQQSLAIKERLGDQSGQASILLSLGTMTQDQGEYEQARTLYQQSLDLFQRIGDQSNLANTLFRLGIIAQSEREHMKARTLYQQSLDLFQRIGEDHGQAGTLHYLGEIAQNQGEYEQARTLYRRSLEIDERLENLVGQVKTLLQLGDLAHSQKEYEQACGFYLRSLDIQELLGDQSGQMSALRKLGIIAQDKGEYEQAHALYQKSLEIAERQRDQGGQANSLCDLGNIAYLQREYEQAWRLYQQSLDIVEQLDDQSARAGVLLQLGNTAHFQGKYEQARRLYQQCLAIKEQLGDQSGQESILYLLGMIAQELREYEQARGLYQQCLDRYRRLGDQSGQANALESLGWIAQQQGEDERARDLYQQCLDISERLGDQSRRANSFGQLGNLARAQGEYEQARGFYQQSLNIFEQLEDQNKQVDTLERLIRITQELGKHEQVQALYRQILEIQEQLGDQSGQASTLYQLGIIAQNQGEYDKARSLYQQSLEIAERLKDQSKQAGILLQLGATAQVQEKDEEAQSFYQQSLEIFEHLGNESGRANCLGRLGMIAYLQEEDEEAQRLYQQSLAIFKQLEDQSGQAGILYLLGGLAYAQEDFEKALMYMIQAYIIFDSLPSPTRAPVQYMITEIRNRIGEEAFMVQWRMFASNRPLIAMAGQEKTEDINEDIESSGQAS